MRGVCMEEKKKTVTKVAEGEKVKKTVKKVAEAAEPVEEKNVKKVETLSKAEEKSKATTLRIVSAILWVLAIGCEVLAILCLFKALRLPGLSQMWWMIIFIVLDLGFARYVSNDENACAPAHSFCMMPRKLTIWLHNVERWLAGEDVILPGTPPRPSWGVVCLAFLM